MTEELRIRNYSERTVTSYLIAISNLSKFYAKSPDKISKDEVKAYAYHLIHIKKASVSTINQLISAWKIFQVDILGNPWEEFRLKRPRKEKKIPKVLSQEEAHALINAPKNVKHRMLLTLAYVTGLRRSELLSLTFKNIDSSRGVIRVIQGKGKKSREIPVPGELIRQLRIYYKRYRPHTFLFEGHKPGKPYSASSFFKVTKYAAKAAGIKKEVYPHVLRHSFATHMLEKGLNLKRLQMILGHNAMKTTSVYLHLADPDSTDLPDLLSPEK